MIQYQSTPDYYREYIEHGYLKDQAAKVHKYIKRWKNQAGKWVYQYKSKAEGLGTKARRTLNGVDSDQVTVNNGKEVVGGWARDNGKASSISGTTGNRRNSKGVPAYNNNRGVNVKAGIEAGRKRAAHNAAQKKKKETGEKFDNYLTRKIFDEQDKKHNSDLKKKRRNLSERGYSSSKGSRNNNKATSNALRGRENREYIKNQSALLKAKSNTSGREEYTRESVGKRKRRVKQINDEYRLLKSKGWVTINGIQYPPDYKYLKKKK